MEERVLLLKKYVRNVMVWGWMALKGFGLNAYVMQMCIFKYFQFQKSPKGKENSPFFFTLITCFFNKFKVYSIVNYCQSFFSLFSN